MEAARGICIIWIHYSVVKPQLCKVRMLTNFYGPVASADRGHRAFGFLRLYIDQVKIFVQGRTSRPINGSKLIFHMRMYLYETSRNIQEPWPHDLYFMVHWLQTLVRLSRLSFLSKVESQDLLMVASWYFIWGCPSMRPAGIYTSHDLVTYISQSAKFRLWSSFHGSDFCHK